MPITGQVSALIKKFQQDNPKAAKPSLSKGGGERTADDQLKIILDPKRYKNYKNIKKRFLDKFELDELPAYDDLKPDQTKWWLAEIKKQAGKPNGFAHVGGKAQDVSLKGMPKDDRAKLREVLIDGGFGVLNEFVTAKDSDYGVAVDKATVFHVYKK